MARGSPSESERRLDGAGSRAGGECRAGGLRVRFLDEEGNTERTVSADVVDCAVSRVKKIHFLRSRSSSETSILLRNPSLLRRRSSGDCRADAADAADTLNNNSSTENLNGKDGAAEAAREEGEGPHYKRNCNVYSVNRARTLTLDRKKSLTMPRLIALRETEPAKSTLPAEVSLAEAGAGAGAGAGAARALGRLSRGLGRLLRRTNSVRISEPDPVYKVAYLGNVLTGWARGEGCIEKPLATLWRNYQQSTKPDVVMKLSVTNSGLKGVTKEHGLTEYWSHRVTYCASPPHYPRLFCWVYRHEGKKLKHELRCHAVLCTKETISKRITEELQVKLKQALVEFKKDRISKQNARLSLANSVYDNPSMPRRKILLSVGALNYRPPLERSKSAPKLGAIEELWSEEDEEEAELNSRRGGDLETSLYAARALDRRRAELRSPRKMSCPEGVMNALRLQHDEDPGGDDAAERDDGRADERLLAAITEATEGDGGGRRGLIQNYLVTDSDDGSVSSGCETASSLTSSDAEPTSLPSQFPPDEAPATEQTPDQANDGKNEVIPIPIGEKALRRRSTYPPPGANVDDMTSFGEKFESLMDDLTAVADLKDVTGLTCARENAGDNDNDSACSDESGYSELLDGKDGVVANTIMV
ncbi:uncharacterized protein LOC121729332 [Aricia agestis]|uniref:uncharacterized protein LOC121729332 n=1 Tax=Aricia agestis TaxID=91739 RepID=UPI001C20BC63|nr:uncharacterized protein LOC121729332 [Aricia agestis]